jgi:putative transposase
MDRFCTLSFLIAVLTGGMPYHEERNHQGKGNLILFPLKREGARDRKAAVRCRERLGSLLKYYEREAA